MQQRINQYTHLKVFSATKAKDRDELGETVNKWLDGMRDTHRQGGAVPGLRFSIVDTVITQSSDSEFHCLVITIFYTLERREAQKAA